MNQGFDHYDNTNQRLHQAVAGQGPSHSRGSSSKEQTDKALQYVDKLIDANANHPTRTPVNGKTPDSSNTDKTGMPAETSETSKIENPGHPGQTGNLTAAIKIDSPQPANRRFFLWVHYYDPHFIYENHPEVQNFGPSEIDRYDNEIRYTDHHIGRLINGLKQRGLYDRTVFVITGDHGEGFGEHGIKLHGYHLYAAQTKVPLIIRIPGAPPRRSTTPAGHVDILPTLANLVGAKPTTEMMGRSLLDILTGQTDDDPHRWVFQQLSYENNNEMRAGANANCHIIYNVSPHNSWELYRLDRDPNESRDTIDNPGPCDNAREALIQWYDNAEIPAGAANALLSERPQIAKPANIDFGSEIRLLDVEFDPVRPKPGDSLKITYTFEARGTLTGGWKFFVHFKGDSGGYFQGDHEPPRPFAWWKHGQYIRYTQTVTIPANTKHGQYSVLVGIARKYRDRWERRPITLQPGDPTTIQDNAAALGTITVAK